MKIAAVFSALSLLAFAGCATCPNAPAVGTPATTAAPAAAAMVFEAESLILTEGEVVVNEKASGGKAVKLGTDKSVVMATFEAPAGDYLVTAMLLAPDEAHDALYLGANDSQVVRTFSRRHNRWTFANRFLTFKAEKGGTQNVKVAVAWPNMEKGETGILVDRVEIVPISMAAAKIKEWQE